VKRILDAGFQILDLNILLSCIKYPASSIYTTFATMIIPQSLKLETDKVILRPMQHDDISSFARITNDASVWRYFTFLLNNSAELQRWVETAVKEREEGKRIPFTIIEKATGDVCGSTSLGSISYYDKRIEIGWSWLAKHYQGTGINFHAKFCMLSYAFDVLDWERVEIKTDNLNERAKQGLRKIGELKKVCYAAICKCHWTAEEIPFSSAY